MTTDAERVAMLSAVHGALVDAGCAVGEIGACEAALVRQLTAERDRLRAQCEVLLVDRDVLRELLRTWARPGPLTNAQIADTDAALGERGE